MSHESLAIIWFGLWGLIWTVYFVLDGYVLGTGMLFPFISKNESERRQLQNTIGPFWGGHEVWLITAGGATFAAFPLTYALMFSYLYTPLMLILFALFYRAAGLEFMSKDDNPKWQSFWKWSFAISSFLIPLLLGVAFANMYYGLPFDDKGYYGNILSLLHPYGLLGGLLFVALFLFYGTLWVAVKNEGAVKDNALKYANQLWYFAAALLAIFFVATANRTDLFNNYNQFVLLYLVPVLSLAAILLAKLFLKQGKLLFTFLSTATSIFTLLASGFIGMFPNMLPAKDPKFSIDLFEAAGSKLNLQLMFIVALILVPVVIVYQVVMYRAFRHKITPDNAKGYN